jgi:Ca-activated chloride channel homolog
MSTRARARRLLLGLLGLVVASSTALVAAPASADEPPRVLLLLDVSGSMGDRIAGGGTKMAAAKKALKSVAASLPVGTQVGLRVYGSQISEPQSKNPKACQDTRLAVPIGPLDRSQMNRAVDSFSPRGETPIAYSMGKAVDDLGDSGKRVLILVSDGAENCDGDPCPVAKKLADRGVDLQFNAIGLAVDAKARKQLQCIAKAGDGAYYDANDTSSLDGSLRKLTQRALRPFDASGTPVRSTSDPTTAPEVGPGQYLDRYASSQDPHYYRINRTPGSTVTATIDTVIRDFGEIRTEKLDLTLSTLSGQACSDPGIYTVVENADVVVSAATRSSNSEGVRQPPAGCAQDPQLLLKVVRTSTDGGGGTIPVELVVGEQPEVVNRAELPESVAGYDGRAAKVAKVSPVKDVVAGSGFSNAAEIGPGSWADTIAFGETVLYRTRLDYGQRLRVTATLPSSGRVPLDRYDLWITRLKIYTPARLSTMVAQQKTTGDQKVEPLTLAGPEVRVNNDELALPLTQNAYVPDASTASVAGDYYVALQLQPQGDELKGVDVPVRLDVAVDGQPAGLPQLAASPTPTPTGAASTPSDPSASATPDPSDGASGPSGTTTLLAGVGIGLLVAGGAVALVLGLRRRGRHAG